MLNFNSTIFALIGQPTEQENLLENFNQVFQNCQFDGILIPFDISENGLTTFFHSIRHISNIKGAIINAPYQHHCAPYCDAITPISQHLQAVNIIYKKDGKLHGHFTEGESYLHDLEDKDVNLTGKSASIEGLSAIFSNAVAWSLLESGVELLILRDDISKADAVRRLRFQLMDAFPKQLIVADFHKNLRADIVVSAQNSVSLTNQTKTFASYLGLPALEMQLT